MSPEWFCEHGFTHAQRKAIEEKVAGLLAALQPFADAYTEERWLDLSTPYATPYDDTDVAELRYDDTGVTLGMLRRARAALGLAFPPDAGTLTSAEADELRRQGDG